MFDDLQRLVPEDRPRCKGPRGGVAQVQYQENMRPLRVHLKAGTRLVHDRLDVAVAGCDLAQPAQLAQFLGRQLAAREAIEEWADRHCPALLRPPSTAFLLCADLDELAGCGARDEERTPLAFALPAEADPLGLAWAIAGSHMGNQAILVRLRRRVGDGATSLPSRFLGDKRMTGFWHRLVPRLQECVSAYQAEPALLAAQAVFSQFERAFLPDATRCRQAA